MMNNIRSSASNIRLVGEIYKKTEGTHYLKKGKKHQIKNRKCTEMIGKDLL